MFKGNQSILICAEKEHVYQIAVTYPRFVSFFSKGSQVLAEDERSMSVLVCTKLLGFFPTRWIGHGMKQPFQSIEFIQEQGVFKGLKAVWTFSETHQGTLVTIATTFSKKLLPPFGEKVLGTLIVEKTTKKILLELKRAAETVKEVLLAQNK